MAISFDRNSLDRDALNLSRAIGLAESGSGGKPKYDAVGDNGESKGAYQFNKNNFEAFANELGLDPKDFSPANQDKVAYGKVKKWKDEGLDPGQIASKWNSGSPDNWKDHKKVVNGKVIYDTPAYVNNVKRYYTTIKQQQTNNPPMQGGPAGVVGEAVGGIPRNENLGDKLKKDFQYMVGTGGGPVKTGLSAIAEGGMQLITGKDTAGHGRAEGLMDIGRGAMNVAGGLGGAIGDVVGAGLGLGFKTLDAGLNKIGIDTQPLKDVGSAAVNAIFDNPEVQKVLSDVSQFGVEHPYIKNAAGDTFNIFTSLIPAVKTASAVKQLVFGGITAQVAKDQAGRAILAEAKAMGIKDPFQGVSQLLDDAPTSLWTKLKSGVGISKKATVNELYGYADDAVKAGQNAITKELVKSGGETYFPDVIRSAGALAKQELAGSAELAKVLKEILSASKGISSKNGAVTLAKLSEIAAKNTTNPYLKNAITQEIGIAIKSNGLTAVEQAQQKLAESLITKRLLEVMAGQPAQAGLVRSALAQTGEAMGTALGQSTGLPGMSYVGNKMGEQLSKSILGNKQGLISQALLQKGKGLAKNAAILGASNIANQPKK